MDNSSQVETTPEQPRTDCPETHRVRVAQPLPVVRRFTWLLLLLLVAVAALGTQSSSQVEYVQVQRNLPEVVAPEGVLAEVFDNTRPATLRVEARVDSLFLGGPLGVGSGFFISPEGLVVTAYHVVDTSEIPERYKGNVEFLAVTPDEQEYSLKLVGFDAYLDLAVMQAEVVGEVPFLPLAESLPRVGSEVVAIGNSRDSFLEARAGRVTQIGVDAPRARFADDTIQLTAALAPGDSGGPVINEQGEVLGVVSYIALNNSQEVPQFLRGYLGSEPDFAAYAAPILNGSDTLNAIMMGERRDVPVIGFSWGGDYNPAASQVDLGDLPGAVVGTVRPGSPAELAGLQGIVATGRTPDTIQTADVIVALDGEAAPSFNDLIELLYIKGVGETVTVTVQRGGETFKLRLELGAKREVFN